MIFPFIKEAVTSLFKKPSTERFPFEPKEAFDHYRGRIEYDPEKCVNCGMCMKVCAPAAITRTVEKLEEGDKITFEFYMGSCTFCQMCADFCPRKAIELTKDYLVIGQDKEDFITRGTFIKKPIQKPAVPIEPKKEAKTE